MTIIELFPWIVALQVAILTGTLLHRLGLSIGWVGLAGVVAGMAGLFVYRLILSQLITLVVARQRKKDEARNRR